MPGFQKCCWLVTIVLLIVCLLASACKNTKTEIEPSKPPPTTTEAKTSAPALSTTPSPSPAIVKTTEPPTTLPSTTEPAVTNPPSTTTPVSSPAPSEATPSPTTPTPTPTTPTPTPTTPTPTTPTPAPTASSGGGGGGGGGGSSDRTPPAVESTSPEEDATGVLLNVNITASFSETLDEDTVTGDTFVLYRDDTRIDGSVSYASKMATFNPSQDLSLGTVYTATLTTGIEDSKGNKLESEYSWSFTTVEPEPLVVESVTPEGVDVPVNATVSAIFNKDLDTDTISSNSFKLKRGTSTVYGELVYISEDKLITFIPDSNLPYNSTYTATITTAIKDIEGVSLESEYSWSFTTGESITSVQIGSDTVSTGEAFVIEVEIQNVTELAAYQMRISYDHSLLQVDETELFADLENMGQVGGVTFSGIVNVQENGDLLFIAQLTGNPASGDGYMARIPFIALENTGQSDIVFYTLYDENKLFDYDQFEIPSTWEDGSVTVSAP